MATTTEVFEEEALLLAAEGPAKARFNSRYPDLMAWFEQHVSLSSSYGRDQVRAALKAIWQQEIEFDAESFRNCLDTGNW